MLLAALAKRKVSADLFHSTPFHSASKYDREREREREREDKTRQDYFIVRPPAHNNRVNIHTVSVIIESLIRLNFVF